MRIGIIAPEFPPDIGGVETYSYEFARELGKRGHEVLVFTTPHKKGEISIEGVQILPVLIARRNRDSPVLKKFKMDAWHVMNAAYAWVALEVAQPVIVSVHGNDFLWPYIRVARANLIHLPGLWRFSQSLNKFDYLLSRRLTRRLVQQALPQVGHIIANSRYTEKVLLEHYPKCQGKTSVGLVGVADSFLNVERVLNKSTVSRLITISRLSDRRKNVDRVLHALAQLRNQHDFSYTIVGDGHQKNSLERLSRDLGLSDRVTFTGFVSDGELKRLLANSDLFTLTSSINPGSHEGFGIAYLEASACGIPVLAARLAGAIEAVNEGVSGMFVEEPTVPALKEALERFLSGQVKFDSNACKSFANQFTWERVVDHAERLYT